MAVKKSRKRSGFVIYSYHVYRQCIWSKLGMWKKVPLVNRWYTKRVPFLPKMVYKRVRDWTSGWSLAAKILVEYLLGPVWKRTGIRGKVNLEDCGKPLEKSKLPRPCYYRSSVKSPPPFGQFSPPKLGLQKPELCRPVLILFRSKWWFMLPEILYTEK